MSYGGSKKSRNLNVAPRQPEMEMAVNRPPTSDLKPEVVQHLPLQDHDHTSRVNMEHKNEEQSERISSAEWEALLRRTYKKYAESFPELGDAPPIMFNSLRVEESRRRQIQGTYNSIF